MSHDTDDTSDGTFDDGAWVDRLRNAYPNPDWGHADRQRLRYDILSRIETAEADVHRRRSPLFGLRHRPVVASLALVLLMALGGLFTLTTADRAVAAVDFRTVLRGQDSFVIASIVDPFRAEAEYNAAFAEHGLDVTIELLPASPSRVGRTTVISDSGTGIKPLTNDCRGPDCPIEVEIPADFSSSAAITIGRPARGDENYIIAAPASTVPGEVFAGLEVDGISTEEMINIAADRGVALEWKTVVDGTAVPLTTDDIESTWVVLGTTPLRANTVLVWVG